MAIKMKCPGEMRERKSETHEVRCICGCIFSYEEEDMEDSTMRFVVPETWWVKNGIVTCPWCKRYVSVEMVLGFLGSIEERLKNV